MRSPGRLKPEQRSLPATPNQSRYVLAELAGAGSYMISVGHLVEGAFNRAAFKRACKELLQRHEALRTRFQVVNRQVFAVVDHKPSPWLKLARFTDTSFDAFSAWATPQIFKHVDPRAAGSLLRILVADYGDSWRFTIAGHHAVTDGISRGVMNRELLKLYMDADLPPAQSYSSIEPALISDLAAPVEQLVDSLPSPQRLFNDGAQGEAEVATGVFEEMKFDGLSKSVRSVAKATGATRFSVLSAVYALSLRSMSGFAGFSSCFQSEGRKAIKASNAIIGPFSNTLPLDLSFDDETMFGKFTQTLEARTKAALAVETGPVMETLQASDKVPTVSLNMFPPAPRIAIEGLPVGPREFLDRRTEYDLNLVWSEDGGVLTGRAFYNPQRLSADRVQILLRLQERFIQAALANPDRTCGDLIAGARQASTASSEWTQARPLPPDTLHAPVFAQAQKTPEADAIITSRGRVSYAQLHQRALQYQAALHTESCGSGDVVAIIADRAPDLIAAILGVSSAGGQFVVVDAMQPTAKLHAILDAVGATWIIRAKHGNKVGAFDQDVDVRARCQDREQPSQRPGGADVAYHLFTSGSTGAPKIVSHPAAHLRRFVQWQNRALKGVKPITLMMAGLSHDPIMRDIFLPLSHGGAVAIPSDCEISDPVRVRDLIQRAAVNILHVTPSAGRLIRIGDPNWEWASGKAIFWGGERLTTSTIEDWNAPTVRQFNLYGATETPQAALLYEVEVERMHQPIPIGKPMPWTHVQLVDANGLPVGPGELGEIVIQLSDPVYGTTSKHGERVPGPSKTHYTGDFGYFGSDEIVRFTGRRDNQVNINGNRIELREVEAAAESAPGALHACAVISEADETELRLFVADQGKGLSEAQVRKALTENLDGRAMPHRIIVLDRFPMTQNGKTDRAALRRMNLSSDTLNGAGGTAPKTEAEKQLANLFAKYTGQSSPTREQSVVDLGCDSLTVIELRLALEDYGYAAPDDWDSLPIKTLAEHRQELAKPIGAGSLLSVHGMDAFIVFRCLAISSIVIHHAGVEFLQGASILLFTLTGFSVGRMQVPAILNDGKTGRVWAMIARLLIPVTVVSLALFGLHWARGNDPHFSIITYSVNFVTFVHEGLIGEASAQRVEFWLWFLHAYLQMFLVIAACISIPSIFRWLREDHWRAALVVSIGSQIITALSMITALLSAADFSSVAVSMEYLPTTLMPFVAIGIVCALANSPARRHTAIGLILAQFTLFTFVYGIHQEWIWPPVLIACLYLSTIRLPRFAYLVVASISTQALMIYLTHASTIFALMVLFGPDVPILVNTVIALAVGIALGRILRPVWNAARINQLAEKQIFFGELNSPSKSLFATRRNSHG